MATTTRQQSEASQVERHRQWAAMTKGRAETFQRVREIARGQGKPVEEVMNHSETKVPMDWFECMIGLLDGPKGVVARGYANKIKTVYSWLDKGLRSVDFGIVLDMAHATGISIVQLEEWGALSYDERRAKEHPEQPKKKPAPNGR